MTAETAAETVRIYLENREEFYRTLLARVPEPKFREYVREAVEAHLKHGETLPETIEIRPEDNTLQGLLLRDLLKKRGSGHALARTTISIEEALARAQHVEVTGLLFFETLARLGKDVSFAQQQAENHRACLGNLLQLDDALRYRKIPMPPAP